MCDNLISFPATFTNPGFCELVLPKDDSTVMQEWTLLEGIKAVRPFLVRMIYLKYHFYEIVGKVFLTIGHRTFGIVRTVYR